MKHITLVILMFLGITTSLSAQCEDCSALPGDPGEVEFCFTHDSFTGRCASFVKGSPTFWYEDKGAKKKLIFRELRLPGASHNIANHLLTLQADKKLKLTGADLLFLERALEKKKLLEDIEDWNKEVKFENYNLTESGLAYKVISKANGTMPEPGDKVTVHYTGYLMNGKKFDSSYDRNVPFEFTISKGMVIKGWDEGLLMMNTGSRFLFRIPADLAYGNRAVGNIIPPNATLFFDVVLLSVE